MSLHFQCSVSSSRLEESRRLELGVQAGCAYCDWGQLQNIVRCRYEDVAEVALGAQHE
jgi:hypothetical protein